MKTSAYSRRGNTVSTVRKSQASVAACWRRNERQSCWSRSGAGGTPDSQDVAYQRGGDADAKFVQLADDPDIAPAGVLAHHSQDEFAHLAGDRRSAGTPVRVRPVARDE